MRSYARRFPESLESADYTQQDYYDEVRSEERQPQKRIYSRSRALENNVKYERDDGPRGPSDSAEERNYSIEDDVCELI